MVYVKKVLNPVKKSRMMKSKYICPYCGETANPSRDPAGAYVAFCNHCGVGLDEKEAGRPVDEYGYREWLPTDDIAYYIYREGFRDIGRVDSVEEAKDFFWDLLEDSSVSVREIEHDYHLVEVNFTLYNDNPIEPEEYEGEWYDVKIVDLYSEDYYPDVKFINRKGEDCTNFMKSSFTKRCPNGSRKDPETGECIPKDEWEQKYGSKEDTSSEQGKKEQSKQKEQKPKKEKLNTADIVQEGYEVIGHGSVYTLDRGFDGYPKGTPMIQGNNKRYYIYDKKDDKWKLASYSESQLMRISTGRSIESLKEDSSKF